MRLTNSDLRCMFRRLNRKYFGNRLNMKIKFGDLSDIDSLGVCHPGEIEIDVSAREAGVQTVEITVLHEMVHAEVWEDCIHGRKFHARIKELFQQGAYQGLL